MNLPRAAQLLIVGILMTRMALFMSFPFLAIHLEKMNFTSIEIGVVLGIHYLFAGAIGIFGGNLADQWGFKRTIMATLLIGALSFWGLGTIRHFAGLVVCNIFLAFMTATFEPTATACIMGMIDSSLRALSYRYRYMAINIGASVGPLIGALLTSFKPRLAFLMTGTLLICYALLFSFMKVERTAAPLPFSLTKLKSALARMKRHKAFLFLLAANFFVYMAFCQIFSTLPQILNQTVEDGLSLYSLLLTVNPITVVIVGLFFSRVLSRQHSKTLLKIGSSLLAFCFLGFHFIPLSYLNAVSLMIVFTIAEIILLPTSAKFLIDIAPDEHRGAYLGAESCSYLGFFAGNLVGGALLQTVGGVFIFCTFCSISAFFFYSFACRAQEVESLTTERI